MRLLCQIVVAVTIGQATIADEPQIRFNALQHASPADAKWTAHNDRKIAAAKVAGSGESCGWRIEDDDDDGAEDSYFHASLTDEQNESARTRGFTYRWRLRIPENTRFPTRAISTEVCVASRDGSDRLRFGLSMGQDGDALIASIYTGTRGVAEGSISVSNVADFHDWVMYFDAESQILNIVVDGRLLLSTAVDHKDTGYHLVFGSRSTGTGVSEWQRVEFSIGLPKGHKIIPPPEPPFQIDVCEAGKGGYHAYRIPSLITAPDDSLLMFCEGRKSSLSDDGDIDLLMYRSKDGGQTWPEPQLVIEEGGNAKIKFGNPTPLVDRETGTIWLAVNRDSIDERGSRGGGHLVLLHSRDNGKSWSKPLDISAKIKQPSWKHYAFGPGIGIQIQHGTHKGRLILPANYRESWSKREPSWSHILYSDDHGTTWHVGGKLGDFTNECQVVEINEDAKSGLLFNVRNHWGRAGVPEKSGHRLVARSFDAGKTWSQEQMDLALSDPPCQASLYRFGWKTSDEPSRILFCNPAGPGRSRLTIRMSTDEGRTWPVKKLIYGGSAAYSCMTRLLDGKIGVIYERDRYGKLTFTSFDPNWLNPIVATK